jgi:hypothetical protein
METGEPTGGGPPAATKPVKTWMIRIEALKFTTDHGLLNDNDTDWKKTGTAIPEPEWKRTPAANGPITHTRKETIEAQATFSVPMPGADTKSATVEGNARIPSLSFKASAAESFGPGPEKTVGVKANAPLPDLVGRITATIVWQAKADHMYAASVSGPHVVFVTYGKPIDGGLVEDGVTLHRMKKAIEWIGGAWATGKTKPVDLIEAVFSKFRGYILNFQMLSRAQRVFLAANPKILAALRAAGFATYQRSDVGGAWPLAEFASYGGECQAIVRLTRAMAHQVGLPGKIEIKYISSEPSDPYKTRVLDDPGVDPGGPLPGYDYALVDGPVVVGHEYGVSDGVGFNRYEAFLKYTDGAVTWFGGGIGRMPDSTKESDLVKVFWGLAAVSAGGPDPGDPGYPKTKIEHVWKY